MATVTKIIGPISAYAIAVANGYTGTEVEFAEEIANASTNAQTAQAASNHCDDVLESIPEDYSALSASVTGMTNAGHDNAYPGYNFLAEAQDGYWESKTPTSGNVSSDTIIANSGGSAFKGVRISVTQGERYEICAKLNTLPTSGMLWAVQNSSRVTLFRGDSTTKDTSTAPAVVEIPENGAYLLVNYEPAQFARAYVVRTDGADHVTGVSMTATNRVYARASANIAAGELFIANNRMYKATAAIGTGNVITPGTNCTETSVVEQLNLLLSTSNITLNDHALIIP